MGSMLFCFYNQQLSALSLISVTGNRGLVFPAPDLLVHSKLNQQSKEMLYLLQAPCTLPSSRPKSYQMPLYFFLLETGFLKASFIKKEVRYIQKRLIIHSGTVVSSLGMKTKETDVDFLGYFKCSWKLSLWSSWNLPFLFTASWGFSKDEIKCKFFRKVNLRKHIEKEQV